MFKNMQNKLNVVEKSNIFAIVGAVFALVGLVSLILLPFNVNLFNFDIDFVGGTRMTFAVHEAIDSSDYDAIKTSISEAVPEIEVYSVQSADAGMAIDLKTSTTSPEQRTAIFNSIKEAYNLHNGTEEVAEGETAHNDIISSSDVDPVMGADIRNAAIISALLAILFMLIYIAIRFDIKSGLAAIIALAHDVLVVISAYVVFRLPLNMTFIAVVLTILGYSINATIVIFDRVRENRKTLKKTSFGDVVNISIWETATRSINTTITTLFAVAMIAIFGVESIRNFAIPIIVGVIAGLYSSMFISGPVWAKLAKKSNKAQ